MTTILRKRYAKRQKSRMEMARSSQGGSPYVQFFSVIFVVLALSIAVGAHYSAAGESTCKYRTVFVQSGDTLWSMSEAYAPGNDIRKVIYDIKKLNGLSSSDVAQGSSLKIPLY